MELLLIAVIVIAAMPYVIAPIRVHQRNRQQARPSLEPFDAARHSVATGLAADVRQNVTLLERAGFRTVADLFRSDDATRMRVVLMDTAAEDIALVLGASPTALPQRFTCSVEFCARFAGDRSLCVRNTPSPGVFGGAPGREKERFRHVRDPERLFRIYQGLVARRHGAARRAPPDYKADPAGFLSTAMARELRQQMDTGYLRLDAPADVYRPTWMGACVMTWKLMQPVRDLREWWSDRRARALLHELALEGRDANPVAARTWHTSGHWNWIAAAAAAILLVVHPSWIARGIAGLDRPVPVRVLDDFVVPADFPGAVRALERLAGATATPLIVQDSLGNRVATAGMVVPVRSSQAEGMVAAAQGRFLAKGFSLFRVAQHFGIRDLRDTLALYPATDRATLLRLVGTNGANYGIGPDSIIAWLATLERDQPFILTGIGFDWLEGRFTTPLADPDGLARRLNAFCPDIVTQGTGTVADLARELRGSSQLYCWWD